MNDKNIIIAIYSHLNAGDPYCCSEANESSYHILYVLNDHGMIEKSILEDIFNDLFFERSALIHNGRIGTFESMSELNRYAFHLCEKTNSEKIFLISSLEYNSIMESVSTLSELKNELIRNGNCIENPNQRSGQGFIGKIFT